MLRSKDEISAQLALLFSLHHSYYEDEYPREQVRYFAELLVRAVGNLLAVSRKDTYFTRAESNPIEAYIKNELERILDEAGKTENSKVLSSIDKLAGEIYDQLNLIESCAELQD